MLPSELQLIPHRLVQISPHCLSATSSAPALSRASCCGPCLLLRPVPAALHLLLLRAAAAQALLPPAELLRHALTALLELMLSRYRCTLEEDLQLLQGGQYQRLPPRHQAAVLARVPEKQCLVEALEELSAEGAADKVAAAGRAAIAAGIRAAAGDCYGQGGPGSGFSDKHSGRAACAPDVATAPSTAPAHAEKVVAAGAGRPGRRGDRTAAKQQGRGATQQRGESDPGQPGQAEHRKLSTSQLPASAAFSFDFNVD